MYQRFLPVLVIAAGVAGGCTTVETTQPGAVGIGRKQHMFVSEQEVQQGAAQAYQQELAKARAAGALNRDVALVTRVRAVAHRLIPHTATFRPDAPGWPWEVNVQVTRDMNAYAMPGGKIMVYSGLVERLKLSDDELASVLGHEIAHALREHSRERISRAYAQQLALAGVAAATGVSSGVVDLANMVATVTFQLPFSREQESEADLIGLELMARSGYDPNASVSVWKKMMSTEGSRGPAEFLSTHPSPDTRIQQLEANIPKVMPFYRGAKR